MRISFHEDPVTVTDICRDLKDHGVVYWHTSRENFQQVSALVEAQGVDVVSSCARPNGDFMNFLVRLDLAEELKPLEDAVAAAIIRWQAQGEPRVTSIRFDRWRQAAAYFEATWVPTVFSGPEAVTPSAAEI